MDGSGEYYVECSWEIGYPQNEFSHVLNLEKHIEGTITKISDTTKPKIESM